MRSGDGAAGTEACVALPDGTVALAQMLDEATAFAGASKTEGPGALFFNAEEVVERRLYERYDAVQRPARRLGEAAPRMYGAANWFSPPPPPLPPALVPATPPPPPARQTPATTLIQPPPPPARPPPPSPPAVDAPAVSRSTFGWAESPGSSAAIAGVVMLFALLGAATCFCAGAKARAALQQARQRSPSARSSEDGAERKHATWHDKALAGSD